MTGLLSIVMPTHEVGPWVEETLTSILRRVTVPFELIVVDDHSHDDTVQLVEEYVDRDIRVVIVRQRARGGANARNLGAQLAIGEYMAFVDGDDIVVGAGFDAMVRSLEASGSDMAVGDFLKFSTRGTWSPTRNWSLFRDEPFRTTLAQTPVLIRNRACWNRVFRRSFWLENEITFPEVPRSNDIVPMTRALTAATAIDVLPDVVYLYRDRPGASSMTARAKSVASSLSYFTQELACARRIAEHGEQALSDEYSSLYFASDGWVQLSRFLALQDVDVDTAGDVQHVVDIIRELFTSVCSDAFERLPLDRQLVFALVALGDLTAARAAAVTQDKEVFEPEVIDTVDALLNRISSVVPSTSNMAGRLLLDRVIVPLAKKSMVLSDEQTAEYLRRTRLMTVRSAPGFRADGVAGALLEAVRVDSADRFREVAKLQFGTGLRIQSVKETLSAIVVSGTFDDAVVPRSLLGHIRHADTKSATTIGRLNVRPTKGSDASIWTLRVPARRIPGLGLSELLVSGESAAFDFDPPLVNLRPEDGIEVSRRGRWSRIAVGPTLASGAFTLHDRGSLLTRIKRRVRTL